MEGWQSKGDPEPRETTPCSQHSILVMEGVLLCYQLHVRNMTQSSHVGNWCYVAPFGEKSWFQAMAPPQEPRETAEAPGLDRGLVTPRLLLLIEVSTVVMMNHCSDPLHFISRVTQPRLTLKAIQTQPFLVLGS